MAEEEEEADYAFASPHPQPSEREHRAPRLRAGGRTSEYLVSLGSDLNGSEFEPDWDNTSHNRRHHGAPHADIEQARFKVGAELRVFDELMSRYAGLEQCMGQDVKLPGAPSSHGKRKSGSARSKSSLGDESEIVFDAHDDGVGPQYEYATEFFDIMNGAIDDQMLEGLPAELRTVPSVRDEAEINLRRFDSVSSAATAYDNTFDLQEFFYARKQAEPQQDGNGGAMSEHSGARYDDLRADTDCELPDDSSEDEEEADNSPPVPSTAARRAQNMSRKVANTTAEESL